MSTKKSAEVAVRYTGGLSPIIIVFVATGRKMTIETGESLSLLPSEADGLEGRPDFEFEADAPTPDPTPEPEEGTES